MKLEGLIAAPHTPFLSNGQVNLDLIPQQVEVLLKQKVIGAYICGTTGEGICCSVAERKAVMKAWATAAKGKLFIIAHVGALSLVDAQELAAYAQEVGVNATSIVPPNFFKPGSIDNLIDYINAVLVGAPNLPFYYYHTGMSGVTFDMEQFLIKADGRIPQLAGIKFNYADLYMFQRCLRACGGKYDITWGIDEWFAGALACGAKSAIGSTYNYAAPLYYGIWEAYKQADQKAVDAGMNKVCRIVDLLVKYGGVVGGKAMMAIHGLDMGDVRLPLTSLTAAQKKDCADTVAKILAE
ncbi:MAG: dihydrodipicolinate synthase family protein [Kiritimatiellia bacterium]